jgi:hypothetical protein
VLERDLRFAPAERRPLALRVANHGSEPWPWGPRAPSVNVAYRLYDAAGRLVVAEGDRTPLPCAIAPDTHAVVPALVAAPEKAGSYTLELDLVHEPVRWFEQPARVELTVAERRPRA